MPLRPPTSLLDLATGPLLLGGDEVPVVDLTDGAPVWPGAVPHGGPAPAVVGARVASLATLELVVAGGAGLVVLPAALAAEVAVVEAARVGVVVVVSGRLPVAQAPAAALRSAAGPDAAVVVEVPVTPGSPLLSSAQVAELESHALLAGALLPPLPTRSPAAAGWIIGALAAVMAAGVRTVRGVDPIRFERVRRVHRSWLAGAAVDGGR